MIQPLGKLPQATKKALLNNERLNPYQINEIASYCLWLTGECQMHTLDRYSVEFYCNRVRMFLKGDKGMVKTVKDYQASLKYQPTRKYNQIKLSDILTLTQKEISQLDKDYQKVFNETLPSNMSYHKLKIERLQRYDKNDESMIDYSKLKKGII